MIVSSEKKILSRELCKMICELYLAICAPAKYIIDNEQTNESLDNFLISVIWHGSEYELVI